MSDHKMMIRADARAIGAVTSNDVRGSERWRPSGTKSGPCVSIFPDGTRLPFSATKSRTIATPRVKRTALDNRNLYFERLAKYGAVSDTETN